VEDSGPGVRQQARGPERIVDGDLGSRKFVHIFILQQSVV
jgi:hypothetical protein